MNECPKCGLFKTLKLEGPGSETDGFGCPKCGTFFSLKKEDIKKDPTALEHGRKIIEV